MYRDKARGEARELVGFPGEEFPQLREGEALLFQLANGVQQLKRLVDALGSSKDTVQLRWGAAPRLCARARMGLDPGPAGVPHAPRHPASPLLPHAAGSASQTTMRGSRSWPSKCRSS